MNKIIFKISCENDLVQIFSACIKTLRNYSEIYEYYIKYFFSLLCTYVKRSIVGVVYVCVLYKNRGIALAKCKQYADTV